MPALPRDRALLAAVLSTLAAACPATAGAAAAGPPTGGAKMPQVLPQATGGAGYGDPAVRSLVVDPIAIVGTRVRARGTMPGRARETVILQRLDERRGWRNVARTRVRSTERFELRWRADRSGRVSLRAVLAGERRTAAAGPPPIASINVYRPAPATYYGPGLFGKPTACGQILTPDLHGVAHKRLPCGTLVAITYARREITVPVIDRGPYNGNFSWDLTQATADALGFTGSDTVGYARAERAPIA